MADQKQEQEVTKEQLQGEVATLNQIVQQLEMKNGRQAGYITRLEVEKNSLLQHFQQQQKQKPAPKKNKQPAKKKK